MTAQTGSEYEALSSAAQALLGRQDLLKDLRLVLGALNGEDAPSLAQVESALERAEIDAQAFADIRSRWGRERRIGGQPGSASVSVARGRW